MLQYFQQQLVAHMPKALQVGLALCPHTLLERALQFALNQVFQEAIDDGDVDFLAGHCLRLEICDLQQHWHIGFNRQTAAFEMLGAKARADICFSGNWNDLVLLSARKVDPDTLFFQRRLHIEGDTELGLEVKSLIDNLDFEQLPALLRQGLNHSAHLISLYAPSR